MTVESWHNFDTTYFMSSAVVLSHAGTKRLQCALIFILRYHDRGPTIIPVRVYLSILSLLSVLPTLYVVYAVHSWCIVLGPFLHVHSIRIDSSLGPFFFLHSSNEETV